MKTKKLKLTSAEYKKANELFGSGHERGFAVSKDKDGFYIHTHRARSKSYKSLSRIPVSVRKFIKSTG